MLKFINFLSFYYWKCVDCSKFHSIITVIILFLNALIIKCLEAITIAIIAIIKFILTIMKHHYYWKMQIPLHSSDLYLFLGFDQYAKFDKSCWKAKRNCFFFNSIIIATITTTIMFLKYYYLLWNFESQIKTNLISCFIAIFLIILIIEIAFY
jgi:hypothetical protein